MNRRVTASALSLAAALTSRLAPAQDLANTLRLGTTAAVQRAAEALDHPDAAHIGGLLVLLRAGRGHDDARGVAAELAFAVLGWWSLRDPGVADALFDEVESARDRETERDALWLAAIGAADGGARAQRWLASDDSDLRAQGLWLLRWCGAEQAVIDREIDRALDSGELSLLLLGLALAWEFEVATPERTERLQQLFASTRNDELRSTVLWTLARSAAPTGWMLARSAEYTGVHEGSWLRSLFERTTGPALERMARELPKLASPQRLMVAAWLAPHVGDARLRAALLAAPLDPAERRLLFARAFARFAGDAADLAPFWIDCLDGHNADRRLACLALAELGPEARRALPRLGELLATPQLPGPLPAAVRAAAIHALGALGPAASAFEPDIAALAAGDAPFERVAATWALPRLRGEAPAGPWRTDAAAEARPFELRDLLSLRSLDEALLRAVPRWDAAQRRLALPRLLIALLDERVPTPHAAIGSAGGVPGMAELCDPDTGFLSLTSTLRAPQPTTWPERCGLCVEALRALGPELEPALPLLRWAAPRRPGVVTLLPPTPR